MRRNEGWAERNKDGAREAGRKMSNVDHMTETIEMTAKAALGQNQERDPGSETSSDFVGSFF